MKLHWSSELLNVYIDIFFQMFQYSHHESKGRRNVFLKYLGSSPLTISVQGMHKKWHLSFFFMWYSVIGKVYFIILKGCSQRDALRFFTLRLWGCLKSTVGEPVCTHSCVHQAKAVFFGHYFYQSFTHVHIKCHI